MCLLVVTVLSALLNETDFLRNPFSPLFRLAGISFLAFGILWGVLTAGGRYTNAEMPIFRPLVTRAYPSAIPTTVRSVLAITGRMPNSAQASMTW